MRKCEVQSRVGWPGRAVRALVFLGLAIPATNWSKSLEPQETWRLVEELESLEPGVRKKAQKRLGKRADPGVAAGLVELIFFSPVARPHALELLPGLLGEDHGKNFKAWIEALGRREDLKPLPGYIEFKSRMFARLDPAFNRFLDASLPRTLRAEEVVWGGVKKDGIPALVRPRRLSAAEADYLLLEELVFGISLGGQHHAYPHRILDWHEMANDVIAGRPVSLSYCTLCGSGVLFDTKVGPGEIYTFGSSGLLYRSNKLMYDHQTHSLWSNLTGEPVWGSLVGSGKRLGVLPLTVTTWGEWLARHPDTTVLSLETGHVRDYRPGAAYGRYFASPDTLFPVWKKPRVGLGLEPKDWLWVVVLSSGARKAYPLEALLAQPTLHDKVAGVPVILLTDPASEAVRVYASEGRLLLRDAGGELMDPTTKRRFRIEEEALIGEDGTRLPRLPGHRAYWFGWSAFFPDAELYGVSGN